MLGFPTLRSSFFLLVAAAALPACGDDGADGSGGSGSTAPAATTGTTTGTGECAGVIEDGVCVGKCSPELCSPGNTCVGNRCTLTCDLVADCYPGSTCADATEDDTGAAIKICQPSGKAAILGADCFFGNECDATTVCPDGTLCGASLCGGQACADGLCPDGTACTPQSCDATACRSARCLGAVEGAEESPSGQTYCTQDDCTGDADCAPGMFCGLTRDFHEICGKNVELGSETPCIDPADFTTDGKTFQEGPVSLLRNTCLQRRQCAPCASDLDCSGVPGQVCADIGGETRCATACTGDLDCERDAECLEDPAHPGTLVCTPRFGACSGNGAFCEPCVDDLDCGDADTSMICLPLAGSQRGCFDYSFEDTCTTRCPDGTPCDQAEYCPSGADCEEGICQIDKACNADPCDGEPCVDSNCPDGSYCNGDPCSGEVCVDGVCPNVKPCIAQACDEDECTGTNEECGLAPDGLHYGECFAEEDGVNASSPDYLICYLPYFRSTNKYQCW